MTIRQFTVSVVEEAWSWVLRNAHHTIGTEFNVDGSVKAVFLQNKGLKMRVPKDKVEEFERGIVRNKRPFDTRRYALTSNALRRVRKYEAEQW